jgi:phosphoribosyl-ATP pyrophosphohydrolase
MAQTFTLNDLEKRVQTRAQASADVSYTRKLLDRGVAHCAKKLGEEAVEAAIAAVGEDRERVIGEAADVLYHLLVVLHARGITLAEVEAELGARTLQSGLDEKAARKSGRQQWSSAPSRTSRPTACSPAPNGRRSAATRR